MVEWYVIYLGIGVVVALYNLMVGVVTVVKRGLPDTITLLKGSSNYTAVKTAYLIFTSVIMFFGTVVVVLAWPITCICILKRRYRKHQS